MTDADDHTVIELAVTAAVPGLNGVFTSFSWEGAGHRAVLSIVYLAAADEPSVADIVDRTFRQVWHESPFRPSSIAVGSVVGPFPAAPTTWDVDSLDPRPIGAALGVNPNDIAQLWIDIPDHELVARYGERADEGNR